MSSLARPAWYRVAAVVFAPSVLALFTAWSPALAGPGSGSASIAPAGNVYAGSSGTWTITYVAAEDFAASNGGVLLIDIPSGWSPPQTASASQPGYVTVEDASAVHALSVSGSRITLELGKPPAARFDSGDSVRVVYGSGGGAAAALASTTPGSAVFEVRSQPSGTSGAALIASSPALAVVPGPVDHVRVVDGAGVPVGALSLTADQDTTLHLHGYDAFDNPVRPVGGTWTVTGGIGDAEPGTGSSSVLSATAAGAGYVLADSGGAWMDSTGLVTVVHGAYASLAASAGASGTAGSPLPAAASATDSDGNTVTSGAGSSAAVAFVAYADSTGGATADPDFVAPGATLASGAWSGDLVPRRTGTFWIAARDGATGYESSPRVRVAVAPAAPDHIALVPDTLHLVAGQPDTVAVVVLDAFGNRSPVAAGEPLTLWTDRPGARFMPLSGSTTLYEVTVPAGSDSALVRYVDTQAGGAAGRARAIDANGSGPSLGVAEAPVVTVPNVPAGSIALSVSPDTIAADGADSALVVSGVIRDGWGNTVAAGERFTVSASLASPLGDQDPGEPGVQWLASPGGVVSGTIRSGTLAGADTVRVRSVLGVPGASGVKAYRLRAGAPAGAIALGAPADSVAADSAATLAISAAGLTDANGNAVEDGEPYTVATTLGAIASVDQDAGTPGTQVLASGGAISFLLFGGDSLGTATVSAASARGSGSGSLDIRLVPGDVSAFRSSVAAVSPAPVGPGGSTVTVTLRDAQDHPLGGVASDSIAVSVSGVPALVSPLQPATDASGAIAFRATTDVAGAAGVSVTARGALLDDEPAIVFEPGPLDSLVVSGPPGPLAAGTADTLRVEARDAYGNPIPSLTGLVLDVLVVSGGAVVPDSVVMAGGAAAAPFTPTLASPLTIEVRDGSAHATSFGPVAVTAGPPYRLLAIQPGSPLLAAGDSTGVSASVVDAFGNAVSGARVDASIVSGPGSVAPPSATTDGSGAAAFTLTAGTAPGPLVLALVAAESAAQDSVRADSVAVTVVPAAVASLEVAADSLDWTAGVAVRVRVRPLDRFGNHVPSDTATVTMRPSGGVAWSPASGPIAGGEFVTFGRDTVAESVAIGADRTGGGSGSGGTAVVSPASPASIAIVSGDGQGAVVDRELAAPLRVRVRDPYGNTVPGASVVFRVESGGGSIDVVRGGAADSIAVSDASGIATCEVARVGVTAGPGNQAYRSALLAAPSAQALFLASALPDTATTLALTPAGITLTAGGTATVTATARDRFGNAAPGAAVTFFLGAPASGTLESSGETTGGPGSQSGTTGSAGTVAVRYRAPSTAPAADSIFARGISIAPVGIRASVGAGATASLQVLPDLLQWTAGQSVRVRVRAVDSFGNPVPSDTAVVAMSAAGSAVTWSPASGPLVAGEFTTFARDTLAETVAALEASRTGGGSGSAGPVTVRPDAPSGAIPIAASRDTLTADGRSSASVTLGPVRDAFGNTVEAGTLVRVAPLRAAAIAPDATPGPELDLGTGADGRASLVLVAPTTAGPDTLRVSTLTGSASGMRAFAYVPPPSLAYASGSLAPAVVLPGSRVAFRVDARNTGSGTIQVRDGTVLSFGAGAGACSSTVAAPVPIPSGETRALPFDSVTVSSSLTPGTYAPALRVIGLDATGEPFDFYLGLPGAQVHVAGIQVAAVSATPASVPLGYTDLSLVYDVANATALGGSIQAVSLATSAGGFTVGSVTPSLPAALPAGGTARLTLTVRVPSSGIPAGTVVTAGMTATADFAGSSVAGQSPVPLSFTVESAARIAAVPGGALPARYLRSRTFAPSVRVANNGTSAVTLARGATRLLLVHAGGDSLATGLAAATAVAGGDTAVLGFDSLWVAPGVARGRYAARLVLGGTESGQAFADTVPLDPDSVSVLEPPVLAVSGPLAPAVVSAGQTRPIRLTVTNSGDVPFRLDTASTLDLGAPVSGDLSLGAAVDVGPGASLALDFIAAPLGSPLSPPGPAAATLEARGLEDGRYREESIAAGSIDVRAPAALAYVPSTTRPDSVRAGETHDLTMEIRNDGGSPFVLDPAASRLEITDGVERVVAMGTGPAVALDPGVRVTLTFPGAAFPTALASQPYPVTLSLHGTEWGLADSAGVTSPGGEVVVVDEAAAVQVRALDAGAPIQVAPGETDVRAWGLELTPLVPAGGVTASRLSSIALTVLTDGSGGPAPSTALASVTLRDRAGAILAQTPAGSANPVTLSLATPLALSSGPESLYVEITLAASPAARGVALRLAAEGDLVALDDLTGTPVPVRGGGGLPFTPLGSPEVTLFAKAHGYPNPFRAGREAVLLSYLLAQDASVRVTIYTLLGEVVRELALAAGSPGGARGLNEVPWDGRNGRGDLVRPGVYVAVVEGAGTSERIKVGVLR